MFIFRKKRRTFDKLGMPKYRKSRYLGRRKSILPAFYAPLLLFFTVILYVLFFSNYFEIKYVNIENNPNINQDEVKSAINEIFSQKILGIVPGNNIFLFNENDANSMLLKKFPKIKYLDIERKSYNSLDVKIKEKDSSIIWCRFGDCFYLDENAVAFSDEKNELKMKIKPLKIYEEAIIEEEAGGNSPAENESTGSSQIDASDKTNSDDMDTNATNQQLSAATNPIKINDQVADEYFITFLVELNKQILTKTNLSIKYYKTKGVRTREIIAYTDKNTRLYFNTNGNPDNQIEYLVAFLNESIVKDKINRLQYIYLKSDNKIFYK